MEGLFKYTFGQRSYKGIVKRYPTITFEIKNQGTKGLAKVILEEPGGEKTETDFLPVSIMLDTFSQQAPPKVIFDSMIPSSQNLFQTLEEKYGIVVRKTNIGTTQPTLTYYTKHGGRNILTDTNVNTGSGYSFEFDYDPSKDVVVLKPLIDRYNTDVYNYLKSTSRIDVYEHRWKDNEKHLGHVTFNTWYLSKSGPHNQYQWPLQGRSGDIKFNSRLVRQVKFRRHFNFRGHYGGHGGRTCTYGENHCSHEGSWNCCNRSQGNNWAVFRDGDYTRVEELCDVGGYGKFGSGWKECPNYLRLVIRPNDIPHGDQKNLKPPFVAGGTVLNVLTKS